MRILLLTLFSFTLHAQSFDIYTGSYTGSGGDDSTIVVDAGIDLTEAGKHAVVIVKGAVAQYAVWRGSAHSGDVSSYFYNIADAADIIQTFGTTGFQIGTNASVNSVGETYYYIAMIGDTSLLHCKTYTGNGTGQNVSVPINSIALAWIKGPSTTVGVWRSDIMGVDTTAAFAGNAATDCINAFGAGTVNLETSVVCNGNTVVFYLVTFANSGMMATFRYVGNGADNRDISFGKILDTCSFVFNCKEAANSPNTFTITELNSDKTLLVNNVATLYTNELQSFTNSVVNVGSHALINANGTRYYGFAIGDYTTPTTATTTSKFKGNSAYGKFKGW